MVGTLRNGSCAASSERWSDQALGAGQVFSGHNGSVTCGRFTPDGRAVLTGGGEGDCTLRVWDPKTGTCTHTTQGAHFHSVGVASGLCTHHFINLILQCKVCRRSCMTAMNGFAIL